MSFEYLNVLDPRLGCMEYVQKDLKYGLFKGGINTNWTQIKSNNSSTNSINWSFNTQSDKAIIDRRVYALVKWRVTLTGKAAAAVSPQPADTLFHANCDAPRAYPIEAITQSISANINGGNVNCIYRDALKAQLHFNNDYELQKYDLSQIPTFLDNYQEYSSGLYSNNNPLGGYYDSSFKDLRGSFPLDEMENPAGQGLSSEDPSIQAYAEFTTVSPLILSPFLYSSQHLESGFINVKNMSLTLNFAQVERVWCHLPQNEIISDINVEIVGSPLLLINYINPPLLDSNQYSVNKPVYYNYFRSDVYINNPNQVVEAGDIATVSNQAIQIGTVPKCFYVYVCQQQADQNYTTADVFLPIKNLSVQYLNVSGQFASMTQHDLYNLNIKNGYKGSWAEFSGKTQRIALTNQNQTLPYIGLVGAPIKISAEDLAIPDIYAPGVNTNSQLYINLTFENVSTSPINYQVVVVVVQEGVMTIDEGSMTTTIGFVTTKDVLETRESGRMMPYNQNRMLYGGAFQDKIKSFAESIVGIARKLKPALKSHYPVATEIAEQLGMFGSNKGGFVIGRGGRPKKHKSKSKSKSKSRRSSKSGSRRRKRGGIKAGALMYQGSGLQNPIGGKLVSRSMLKNRLR